jgi:hypothetical protein
MAIADKMKRHEHNNKPQKQLKIEQHCGVIKKYSSKHYRRMQNDNN